jgi:hypothetical protein
MSEAPADLQRIETLANRVCWLDRYRRAISIIVVLLAFPVVMRELTELLGTDWPEAHTMMMSVMLAAIGWVVVEVGLALVTAIWEAEHDRLTHARGLPRAILLRRRR